MDEATINNLTAEMIKSRRKNDARNSGNSTENN